MSDRRYEFGPFRIDLALSRLERGGSTIPLAPKAFDLLAMLTQNTERVLSKAELMAALWPDTYVDEANLTQHVYTLRRTLGDQPTGQPYIETVPRRGYRLAAAVREISAERPQPVVTERPRTLAGERKRANVLDCRLANASAVVERLGPDGMFDVSRDLLAIAAEEIKRYDGAITERRADGFAALFGARAVHEDDARRAVLAVLAIQRRVRELAPVDSSDDDALDLRMGINTGPLIITHGEADSDFTAVGDAVRIAGLLQQMAGPGEVLIGETTERIVRGYIECVRTGDIGGGAAYRVLGPVAATASPLRFGRVLAPFIGRRQELNSLEELAARVRIGAGRVVSIVGEPGIGKSRLLHEFARTVATSGATLLEARCVSYGSLVPYLPLADLVRAHCGIADSDSPESITLGVERVVSNYDLPSDAGAWLLRLLGIIDPASAEARSPEAIKARTFDVLRTLFFKAAAHAPLTVVIEDVHWIDRTSEEFLTTLIERIVAVPMMVMTTYRPGYHAPWLDRSYLSQITLSPLDAPDAAALVESIAEDRALSSDLSLAILTKGEGNPFFLEELTRTVIERGPGAEGIPDTVHGVIMARIDRLPERTKQVIQTASILGREVPLPLLTAVWGSDPAPELADLCRFEFLYERPAADERVFVFKHALTQDVAYDSLLARSRRELHLRAAEALLRLYGEGRDDLAATFAYQYARTDLLDEAVHWLTRAADQAARVYANAEAILHLDLAARRLQRLPAGPARDRRTVGVALRQAHSLYFLGRFAESVQVLESHAASVVRLDDPAITGAFTFWLAHMYSRLADQRSARDNAARAIEAAQRAGDTDTLGKAHGLLALEGHWSGTTADGIAHGDESVRLLQNRVGQGWWLGMTHFYLAMNYLITADFDAALEEARSADAVGRLLGDPRLQTYAAFTAAWLEETRGNHDIAIELARRGREQAPDRVSRAYASMILSFALIGNGACDEATAILDAVVPELQQFGISQWHGFAVALAAETHRLAGDLTIAQSLAQRAVEVVMRSQYWYGVGFAQRVAGRIASDCGEPDRAMTALKAAAGTFERIGARFEAERTRAEIAAMQA